MMPHSYEVGDKVRITQASYERALASNRSSVNPGYPSDSFLASMKEFVGQEGKVTDRFRPGYMVTVMIDRPGQKPKGFHMKDDWVEPA